MTTSFVVLTLGDREEELVAALDSIRGQTTENEIVLVLNGTPGGSNPSIGAKVVRLESNHGVAGGRNAGIRASTGDVIFFLDDDAVYGTADVAERVRAAFDQDQSLGIVSLRVDSTTGSDQSRHQPRLWPRDPTASSDVTTFLGGASAIRREVFETVGMFPDDFFIFHEETDLAWRAMDAGWTITYRGDLSIEHASRPPDLSGVSGRLQARNRVLLARRRLPVILQPFYLVAGAVTTLLKGRSLATAIDLFKGYREGIFRPVERASISWRTIWRMTRLGRPPII